MKQGWFDAPANEKSKRASKITSIVFVAIFACTLVLSVVLGLTFPKAERVREIDGTRFTSVFYAEDNEWFYTTEKNIVRLNDKNEVLETYPLLEEAQKINVEVGQIKEIYASPDEDYVWVATSKKSNENGGFVFKMQDESGKLSIVETASFNGSYKKMLVADGYLYVFTTPDSFTTISKYEVENVSQGEVRQGAIYRVVEGNGTMKLTMTKNLIILSVDVIDDSLYVLHTGGLIKMSTDFASNDYKFTYWERRNEIYERLFAEAEANLSEGEIVDEDALEIKANVETCNDLGIKSYVESSDTVEIAIKKFDPSKYAYYYGENFRGGAYVSNHGKYYIISVDTKVYSYDLANLDGSAIGYIECDVVDGVQLYAMPELDYAAMFYNPYSGKGYIVYDSLPQISCIDFNEDVSLEFTLKAEFDINRITQIGGNIYYFYYNRFETERAGQTVLKVVNIEKQLASPLLSVILTVSIIVCVISGLCALIFVSCWKKDGYVEKTKLFLKRIVRNKWVYISLIPSIILLLFFCYYPAIESIRLSFFEYSNDNPTMRWNKFENYKLIFTNRYTGEMFGNMFLFLVVDLIVAIAPPLVFAFFLTVMRNKGYSQLVRTLLFIPGVIPGIAGMLIWREGIFSNSGGFLHMICSLFTETPHEFLTSVTTTRFEILLIGFPYVGAYLIFYGGMMNIADSYYEAAELEGIGIWKRFFAIDLPLILPQIKYVFITTFIGSVQNFARVDSVTGGLTGTMTPIQMIHDQITDEGAYGAASAYATLMFVFLFFATAMNLRKQKQDSEV